MPVLFDEKGFYQDRAEHAATLKHLRPDITEEEIDYAMIRRRRFFNYVVCCGERLYVPDFTNTCEACGRDYNSSGQALAPRCQWGEETGESAADILRAEGAGFPEDGPNSPDY